MKSLMIALGAASLIAAPALADMPGKNWISRDKVVHMMKARGYQVTKLEADDGHWEGEMIKAGHNYEFHVDPRSGKITKLERDDD